MGVGGLNYSWRECLAVGVGALIWAWVPKLEMGVSAFIAVGVGVWVPRLPAGREYLYYSGRGRAGAEASS